MFEKDVHFRLKGLNFRRVAVYIKYKGIMHMAKRLERQAEVRRPDRRAAMEGEDFRRKVCELINEGRKARSRMQESLDALANVDEQDVRLRLR